MGISEKEENFDKLSEVHKLLYDSMDDIIINIINRSLSSIENDKVGMHNHKKMIKDEENDTFERSNNDRISNSLSTYNDSGIINNDKRESNSGCSISEYILNPSKIVNSRDAFVFEYIFQNISEEERYAWAYCNLKKEEVAHKLKKYNNRLQA